MSTDHGPWRLRHCLHLRCQLLYVNLRGLGYSANAIVFVLAGTMKCCPTGCGGQICQEPVGSTTTKATATTTPTPTPTTKPGSCPVPTGPGVCVIACSSDADCCEFLKYIDLSSNSRPQNIAGVLKCCTTGCGGRICQSPVATTA